VLKRESLDVVVHTLGDTTSPWNAHSTCNLGVLAETRSTKTHQNAVKEAQQF